MKEHGAVEWTSCAQHIQGRNGKQCRERWVNILDPAVKIGGWSDNEQGAIFDLMKEHLTSWSGISKSLAGRTENSIKNYFYSTVRRIQSCSVMEFIIKLKQGKPSTHYTNEEDFAAGFELHKLNNLGAIICKWLFQSEEAKKTNEPLYNYLIQTIADEKKKPKLKDSKELLLPTNPSQSAPSNGSNQIPPATRPFGLPFINSKNLNGTHPFLPMALYGGFTNLSAKKLFQSFVMPPTPNNPVNPTGGAKPPVEATNPPIKPLATRSEQDGGLSDDLSNISVPIPTSSNSLRRRTSHLSSRPDSNDPRIQQALISMLLQNLSNHNDQNKNEDSIRTATPSQSSAQKQVAFSNFLAMMGQDKLFHPPCQNCANHDKCSGGC